MNVTVYDLQSQAWITVPRADAEAGIASGKYEPGTSDVTTQAGTTTSRNVGDLDTAEALGDTVSPELDVARARAAVEAARLESFDTLGDKALTFAEGAVDALTLGLIHETGEKADLRREANSGAALAGMLIGTAAGLGTISPIKVVAGGGERAGKALARAIFTEAASERAAAKVITRGLEEAGIGAALMGSTAIGHQVTDALIEDKAFAGEAVLHEMSLGGALGFGAGILSGGLSVAASRGRIKGQGGLVDSGSLTSKSLVDEVKGVQGKLREAADKYEMQVGILEGQHRAGVIPDEMVKPYREAAREARKAVDALEGLSPIAPDVDDFNKFAAAQERAHRAINNADEVFRAPPSEARPQRQALPIKRGEFHQGPIEARDRLMPGQEPYRAIDNFMRNDPEALAAYERLHGRPYEFLPEAPIVGEGGVVMERFVDDAATPVERTAAGKRRPTPTPEGQVNRINGGVTGAFERGELRTIQREPAPIRPDTSVPPSGEYTQVMPEGIPTRMVPQPVRTRDALSVVPAEANGAAFQQFREVIAAESAVSPGINRVGFDRMGAEARPAGLPAPDTIRDPYVPRGEPKGKPAAPEKTVKDLDVPRGEKPVAPEKTYRDPGVPRGDKLPGDLPSAEEATTVRPRPGSAEWEEFQRRAAEDYVEKWYWEAQGAGRRVSPADEAAARLDAAMRRMSEVSGGRLDSAGALEMGEALGLKPTVDPLVDRLQQLWVLRRVADQVSKAARGGETAVGDQAKGIVDEMARRYMRMQGAAIGFAAGGPLGAAAGWVVGKHLPGMIGFGAKAASSAGRIMQLTVEAGERLLKGRRATIAARAVAGNRAYAYDEEGPIQDPVERIQKIHRVAANPDQVRATVRNQLGDAALANPQLAGAMEEAAVRQVTNLSLRAPAIYFDQLGRAIQPTAGALRKFHEYENATHDLPGLLGAIGTGSVTPVQISALMEQHQAVHGYVARTLLQDPEQLRKLPSSTLRSVESVTGIPLSAASAQPGMVMRFQQGWMPADQPQGSKPQAFKITAPAPTPTQAAANGAAPGNE